MDEETLNLSVRKFLKKVGVTAQRAIEQAVREAAAGGRLEGRTSFPAKAIITVAGIDLKFEVDGEVETG